MGCDRLLQGGSEDSAYWLGFLTGDCWITDSNGSHQVNLELGTIDSDHLEAFRDYIGSDNKIGERRNTKILQICSKDLVDCVKQFGIIEDKSKVVDPQLSKMPKEFHSDYWRGLFDADGSITINSSTSWFQPQIYFRGSRFSCEKFLNYIESQTGHRPKLTERPGSWVFQASCKTSFEILDSLYSGASSYLDRKYQKYERVRNHYNGGQ